MKPFFPIVMWMEASPELMGYNEHTAPDFYKRSFEDIASLHCNAIRPSNLPLRYANLLLTTAANYDLKVILDPQWGHNLMQMAPSQILNNWEALKAKITSEVIGPFSGYENLLGYAVSDEPPEDKLAQWRLTVKMFNELDPARPDYTCFNRPSRLAGVLNDEAEIPERFVYDNYPHERKVPLNTMGTDPQFGWYNMYKNFYDVCKTRPYVPQIPVIAAFKNDNPWRKPTDTEFRTTVYTSLAAGAKGIIFFAYMDVKSERENLECLVNSNWKQYPIYHAVKATAAELEKLGPALALPRRSEEVTGWNTLYRTLSITYQDPIDRRYFIVANKDPNPGKPTYKRELQLTGTAYCLEDIYTGEIFKANHRGIAKIPFPSAYGRVLKEKIGPAPFGSFDSPANSSKDLAGAIPVTGWALDDVGVARVEIKRSPVPGEPVGPDGLVLIGNALFVEGVRPDVAGKYPDYPDSQRSGWGYSLFTNFLPNQGNGTFVLHAIVYDTEGNSTNLGQKTITCNNAQSKKPFGTIDTPAPGDIASGKQYDNWGWVLTPPPNWVPYDGKTIQVFIDEKPIGNPGYGIRRTDLAQLFPHFLNNQEGQGCGGHMIIDTTKYETGLHTISWFVVDSAGNKEGIGSRYFLIQN